MENTKRALAATITALLLLGVSACGNTGDTSDTSKGESITSKTKDEGKGADKERDKSAAQSEAGGDAEPEEPVPAPTPTPAKMDCSGISGEYGAWQGVMGATVSADCTLTAHPMNDISGDSTTIPAASDPQVTVAADGSVSWLLSDGRKAVRYPAGMQVQWFKDITGEPTDPTADQPRIILYKADGGFDFAYYGQY